MAIPNLDTTSPETSQVQNSECWWLKSWPVMYKNLETTGSTWTNHKPEVVPDWGPAICSIKSSSKKTAVFSYGGQLFVKEPSSCPLHKFEGLRSTIGPIQGLKVFSHLSLRQLVQRIVGGSMQQANGQNLREQFNWLRAQNLKTELKSKTMITSHLLMGGNTVAPSTSTSRTLLLRIFYVPLEVPFYKN